MSDLGKRDYPALSYPSLTRFVRKLRGGSQAILAEADDGLLYVVKFTNNLQGPNVLFNESMGSELYRACGLPVAEWTPVRVTNAFLDQNRAGWLQTETQNLRPASGLAFGSRFLGNDASRLIEILPESRFGQVRNLQQIWLAWMVDICAEHGDNRQAIFQNSDGALSMVFIDHGHLFGGPDGGRRVHFSASRYLDTRVYPAVTDRFLHRLTRIGRSLKVDELWRAMECMPEQWRTPSAASSFAACIERLTNSAVLVDIVQSMVALQSRTKTYARTTQFPILRAAVPSRRAEPGRRGRGDRLVYA
ncbi:MAG TPA: hypothetical protein VKB38_15585 [Terracidiphilus sp.]|nr:hypothetical protein [Terracidiphilus sp.]